MWIFGFLFGFAIFCLGMACYHNWKGTRPISDPIYQRPKGNTAMEDFMKTVGAVVAAILLVALDGWIMHLSWAWFVVPTFGIAAIAWPMATGIVLMVSWMTYQHPTTAAPDAVRIPDRIGKLVIISLASWLMMWCVHFWIIH